MIRAIAPLALLAALAAPVTPTAQARPAEPDHWMMVTVNSTPSGATLYAADAPEGSAPIGTTPCVVPVELRWGKGLFGRRWSRLAITSPGSSVRVAYDPEAKAQVFHIRLRAEREGFEPALIEQPLGSIGKNTVPRHTEAQFPSKRTVVFNLTPKAAERPAPPVVRLLMQSGTESAEDRPTGRLEVRARPENLIVQINGQTVGRSPMDLVLYAGLYDVRLQSPGYQAHSESVEVRAGGLRVLDATLQRAP